MVWTNFVSANAWWISSDIDFFNLLFSFNFLSKEINTISLFSIYPIVLYVAIVNVTAVLRLCPLNETSSSAFFASSFKKRTELTLPFCVILYSTPGLISIVTLPDSLSQLASRNTIPIQNNNIKYDANTDIHLDLIFFCLTQTLVVVHTFISSFIWLVAFNNFSFFIDKCPPSLFFYFYQLYLKYWV